MLISWVNYGLPPYSGYGRRCRQCYWGSDYNLNKNLGRLYFEDKLISRLGDGGFADVWKATPKLAADQMGHTENKDGRVAQVDRASAF
jgi:hypothetical protein